MNRLTNYLLSQAKHSKGVYPFKLTPGQYKELCKEQRTKVDVFKTDVGYHPVLEIVTNTKAVGDNVILAPREDLFSEVESDTGITLVCTENEVTNIPDNTACCEVISVGELVTNVKPGDLAFIDFYDVKQGYVLENESLFVAGAEAFKALFNVKTQEIEPLNNYVVTKRASKRMGVALNGSDRIEVPPYILTDGIPGGKNSVGGISTHILYEEVVSVGKVTSRARPGVMTNLERSILDYIVSGQSTLDRAFETLKHDLTEERERGYDPDLEEGELVVFCKETTTPIRIRGEFCHLIHIDNVLGTIDDQAILDEAIRKGKAGMLII